MSVDIQNYLSDFEQLHNGVKTDWFSDQRLSALNLFKETGFPSSRQENWKYTDVRPIAKNSFSNINRTVTTITTEEINAVRFQGLDCYELVFINGVYSEKQSRLDGLPKNIVIENMADALAKDSELLAEHLSRYADNNTSPFTALNTAFIQHGTYIYVPKNTVIDKPINILYLSKEDARLFPFSTPR